MNPTSNDAFKDLSFMNALDLLTSHQPNASSPPFPMSSDSPKPNNTPSLLKSSKSIEHSSSELLLPTVPSNDSLSKNNIPFTSTTGIISNSMNVPHTSTSNLVNTSWMDEPPKDWRLSISQQDRIQIMMRFAHEITTIVPVEQRNNLRIQQAAKGLEKGLFDLSTSKQHYIFNCQNKIKEIQAKSQAQPPSQASSPSQSIVNTNLGGSIPIANQNKIPPQSQESNNTNSNPSLPTNVPTPLFLSDQEKTLVQDKVRQMIPLYQKMDTLMQMMIQIGGRNEYDKVRRLQQIKMILEYQLEGIDLDRYTISMEIATNLQATLFRFFQYGENLARQKQTPPSNSNINRAPAAQHASQQSNNNLMLFSAADANKTLIQPNSSSFPSSKNATQSQSSRPKVNTKQPSRQSFQFESTSPSSNSSFDQKNIDGQKDEKFGARPDQDSLNQNSRFQDMSAFLNFDLEESIQSPTSTISNNSFFSEETSHSPIKKRKRSLNNINPLPLNVTEGLDKSTEKGSTQKGSTEKGTDKESDKSTEKATVQQPPEKKRKTSLSKQKSKIEVKSTLFTELETLKTVHQFHSESIDLDTLETPNEVSLGKILVLSSFSSNPLKFVFRISSRVEYESVLNTRKELEESNKDWRSDFESSGCGLEEVEVIDYGESKSLVEALKKFTKEIGVGLTGNRAQISDIVRFALLHL